jgi:HTH-type transcriptional regulator / antitoxin HigA
MKQGVKETQSDVGAISAWLRCGEIEAEHLDCPKYNKAKFEKAVQVIRSLTLLSQEESVLQMQHLCQRAGVVFVLVSSIPRAHVSGLARWLNPHRALIQLSMYGESNDRFWFTFFHEVAHILLHDKEDIFLDEWSGETCVESEQEREADRWAREFLIPSQYEAQLTQLKSRDSVIEFARQIGLHPGIVVGRLQHDQIIQPSWMNDLKISFCLPS